MGKKFANVLIVPVLIGLGTVALGWALSTYVTAAPPWAITAAFIIGGTLIVGSVALAIWSSGEAKESSGGGGDAGVIGDDSEAYGGRGTSEARGGSAYVHGNRSVARGGDAGPVD